jgi:hypothetical protein
VIGGLLAWLAEGEASYVLHDPWEKLVVIEAH